MMDLGSVHERSTAIFTITLSQYAPAAVHGEEDRVMVSSGRRRGQISCGARWLRHGGIACALRNLQAAVT